MIFRRVTNPSASPETGPSLFTQVESLSTGSGNFSITVGGSANTHASDTLALHKDRNSSYDALQVVYNLQVAKGLTAGANYVWAHALTNATFGATNQTAGILANDPSYDYGNSDLDVRSRITFHASYALPFAAAARGLIAAAAKGWQVNALGYYQTGMPFTVTSAVSIPNASGLPGSDTTVMIDNNPVSVSGAYSGGAYIELPNMRTDRPNSTGGTKLSGHNSSEWFNIKAFRPQTPGTFGNGGVNQVVGPSDRRLDLSVMKDFAVSEGVKLQFRAESFNITNTENFALPNYQITAWDPTGSFPAGNTGFGSITQSAFTENPRQFQFALKLLF